MCQLWREESLQDFGNTAFTEPDSKATASNDTASNTIVYTAPYYSAAEHTASAYIVPD